MIWCFSGEPEIRSKSPKTCNFLVSLSRNLSLTLATAKPIQVRKNKPYFCALHVTRRGKESTYISVRAFIQYDKYLIQYSLEMDVASLAYCYGLFVEAILLLKVHSLWSATSKTREKVKKKSSSSSYFL